MMNEAFVEDALDIRARRGAHVDGPSGPLRGLCDIEPMGKEKSCVVNYEQEPPGRHLLGHRSGTAIPWMGVFVQENVEARDEKFVVGDVAEFLRQRAPGNGHGFPAVDVE